MTPGEGSGMKLSRDDHLVLDIADAFIQMEDAEIAVAQLGSRQSRIAMADANERYNDLVQKSQKKFKNIDMLYAAIDVAVDLLKGLRALS